MKSQNFLHKHIKNQLVVEVTSLTNDCLSCQEYHIALIENYNNKHGMTEGI